MSQGFGTLIVLEVKKDKDVCMLNNAQEPPCRIVFIRPNNSVKVSTQIKKFEIYFDYWNQDQEEERMTLNLANENQLLDFIKVYKRISSDIC